MARRLQLTSESCVISLGLNSASTDFLSFDDSNTCNTSPARLHRPLDLQLTMAPLLSLKRLSSSSSVRISELSFLESRPSSHAREPLFRSVNIANQDHGEAGFSLDQDRRKVVFDHPTSRYIPLTHLAGSCED